MANEKLPPGFDPLSAEPQSPQMGALGKILENSGRNDRDENLAYWAGSMAPSPNGTGGALGNALKSQSDYRLERDKLQAQYMPLILQSMSAQFQRQAIGDILGPQGQSAPGAAPDASAGNAGAPAGAAPGGGDAAGPAAGPAAAPTGLQPSQNPSSRLAGYSIDQIVALDKLTGLNLMDSWKIAKEGFERKPGSFYDIPGVGQVYVPDPTKGIGYANGKVYQLDQAGKVLGELAGATASATERAKAEMTPLPQTFVKKGTDDPIGGTVAGYVDSGKPQAKPGGMQTAPQDKDAAMTLSAEFDNALERLHQLDPKVTDRDTLKRAGDDVNGLAREMKSKNLEYIQPALRSVTAGMPTREEVAQAEAGTGGAGLQGPAEAAGRKITGEEAAKSGQAYQNTLHDKVEADFQLVQRNKQIMPLLDRYNSGGMAPDERLHVGNALATSGAMQSILGKDNAKKFGDVVAGGDVTAGKALENQLAAAGISNLLQTLDKEGKPNRAEFQVMNDARESLHSGNATLKDVFELQKRLYDIHYNEQQALTGAIKSGTYDPRTWAGDYSKVRNEGLSKPAAPLPSAGKPADIDALLKKYGG